MTGTEFLFSVGAAFAAWGLLTAWLAGRLGRDRFAWWFIGTALGPLSLAALVGQVQTARRDPPLPALVEPPPNRPGPHILVAADRPGGLVAAAATARARLGWMAPVATLALLADAEAAPIGPVTAARLERERAPAARRAFAHARAALGDRAVGCEILFGEFGPAVVAEARRGGYACVVLRAGRHARRALPSPCPVLVVAPATRRPDTQTARAVPGTPGPTN